MRQIPFIDNAFMESHTDFRELIGLLDQGFSNAAVQTPMRHHHDYSGKPERQPSRISLFST